MVNNARKRLLDFSVISIVVVLWFSLYFVLGVTTEKADGVWRVPGAYFQAVKAITIAAAPLASFVALVGTIYKRRLLAVIVIVAVSGLGVIMAMTVSFMKNTNHPGAVRVTAADGHEYMVLASGFQDWRYWLGRVESTSAWETVVRPIAHTSDYSSPTVRLVRPRDAEHQTGGLQTTADGRYVVVEVWDGCASIAFDTKTGKRWSAENSEEGTIEKLSPFILLDDDDELDPADVAALRGDSKCPRSKSLHELDPARFSKHPNAAVRELFAP